MRVFHYHLVTSLLRQVEARYVGKLNFNLVARHGRVGDKQVSYASGVAWDELDQLGFKLRLSELEKGAVNIVVQPGHWRVPRVDHLGVALDEEEFEEVLARAAEWRLRVQEHAGRRTFVATNAGYRLEIHPPRDWIDELLAEADSLTLRELQLRADDPAEKAEALAALLGLEADRGAVEIGETLIRFIPGGPEGRPELHAELFA